MKNLIQWTQRSGYHQGVFWALLTALVSISNDVITKCVGTRLSGFEISFFRFLFSTLTVLPFMMRGGAASFKTTNPKLHIWRAILGFGGVTLFIFSLIFLPLAEVSVFSFTQPLFFMPIAILFLNERISNNRWIAAFVGFVGICIILRPGTSAFNIYALLPICSAIMFALLDMLAKKMVSKESALTMLFYFGLGTTLAAFIPALMEWQTPTWGELFWLLCLGGGANLIQVCLFKAFAATDASSLAPFRYVEFVFALGLGYLFFNEVPTFYVIAGAVLIIISTLYMAIAETRRHKKRPVSG